MSVKPRLMIVGYAEHGKDSVCRILREVFGLTYASSSYFAMELFLHDLLRDKYGLEYKSKEECYQDRYNKRQIWYEEIKAYNTPDGCKLARDLYNQFNIYNGCRNIVEFEAIQEANLFDYSIWIDASERKPKEGTSSCTIKPEDADIILFNNGELYETTRNLIDLIIKLYPQLK